MSRMVKVMMFILLAGVAVFGTAGCTSKASDSTSVTSPNSGPLTPTGTIQGHIFDAVTQQPIVGAKVDIGVGSAVTSETGEFVIRDVPATTDALNGSVTGNYRATIDMRGVTSPINMTSSSSTPRYAEFAHFDTVAVNYTSLDDTNAGNPGGGSGTNHDTPVTGLVAVVDFTIGKLAADINGVVAFNSTKQPVGAGYTVKLISQGSNISGGGTSSGTGNTGNVIMTATTDANGAFQFANIESLQTFAVSAQSSDGLYSSSPYTITAPADGETKTMNIQSGNSPTSANLFTVAAVFVVPTDNIPPVVTDVTPERNTDLALNSSGTTTASVVFSFSEAMLSDAYANLLSSNQVFTSGTQGLYNDIAVNFLGNKAGNIAHSLAWSADRKTLTVTIPNLAPSSIYDVNLSGAVGKLKDVYENTLVSSPSISTRFTTNGAPTASAVSSLVLFNSASINAVTPPGTRQPSLDWAPVSGAKSYNVYRQTVQVWPGGLTETAPYTQIGTGAGSSYAEPANLSFVENSEIQLKYNYMVRSVNSDAEESANSNVQTAADVIAPRVVFTGATTTANFLTDIADGDDQITIPFNEPMREAAVTVPGNWTISGITGTTLTVTAVRYDSAAWTAVLTLSGPVNAQNVKRAYISVGSNGYLETTAVAGDRALMPVGSGGVCIIPPGGTDTTGNTLDTVATSGDDIIATLTGCKTWTGTATTAVYAGPDGICNTTANANDLQVIGVGSSPSAEAITAATYGASPTCAYNNANNDFTLQTTVLGGDDAIVHQVLVTLSNANVDVAGNAVNGSYDQVDSDGRIH